LDLRWFAYRIAGIQPDRRPPGWRCGGKRSRNHRSRRGHPIVPARRAMRPADRGDVPRLLSARQARHSGPCRRGRCIRSALGPRDLLHQRGSCSERKARPRPGARTQLRDSGPAPRGSTAGLASRPPQVLVWGCGLYECDGVRLRRLSRVGGQRSFLR
jgi:hypothetical protein